MKFRDIVGVGRLKGPVVHEGRADLYYWEATSRADVGRVAELMGPWLCPVKRSALEHALDRALSPAAWPGSSSEELAWAGGFFDGEGSTYLLKHRTHAGQLVPVVDVSQSGWDGVPVVLARFRAALGEAGSISGPHLFRWAAKPVSRWRSSSLTVVSLVLHRLYPFIGTVKRVQACQVFIVVNSQPELPRGNPAWGRHKTHCVRGHEYETGRLRPYRSRGVGKMRRPSQQCLVCARDQARERRKRRAATTC